MHSTSPLRRVSSLALSSLATVALLAAPAAAQQPPPVGPPPGPPGITRVYTPIEEFDRLYEEGGVFLTYQELLRLLDRIEQATRQQPAPRPVDVRPPADYLLVGATLRGEAGERVVHFEATFDIEVLEERGWVVVPINLGEAALEEVRVDGGSGRAAVGPMSSLARQVAALDQATGRTGRDPLPQTGYGIVLRGAGRVQTTARFAVPIASPRAGQSHFRLTLPGAALNQFEVLLPQSGLGVQVDNALASEPLPVQGQDQTRLRAYFGAAAEALVTWNPRPRQVEERPARLFAATQTTFKVEEGVLQSHTRVRYQILQAPCGEFRLQVPAGYVVISVRGENLAQDPVPEPGEGGTQVVVVRLHAPVADRYDLDVVLERSTGQEEAGASTVDLPRVVTLGTERESGLVAVRPSEFLTLEPARADGVSQIDVAALPEELARQVGTHLGWAAGQPRPPLVFRYLRQPYGLQFRQSQVQPEVDGRVFTLAIVKEQEVALATTVRYTIRKRGIFGVRLRLPAGFVLLDVGDERLVKDHRVEPASEADRAAGQGDVLVVDFQSQQAPGTPVSLLVLGTLHRAEVEGTYALARLSLLDVQRETGVLAVGAQSHLQLTPEPGITGLQTAVSPRELAELEFPHAAAAGEEITFRSRYAHPDGIAAAFTVRKRAPKVTARVEALVDAQEEAVRVESTIRYTVEYAGVEQVRVRVPAALATEEALRIEGDVVKDRRVEVQGDRAVWTIGLQEKRTGTFAIVLRYDIKLDDLAAGQQRSVTLHELEVLDCFTETGDYALVKHENLVISEQEMAAVERRDQRELPEALRDRAPIQAYRYTSHPHRLTLQIVKYDFQAPLGILVNHLHQDEVVTRDGPIQVEAWIELQNNAEQYLTVLLPAGVDARNDVLGLKVNGETEDWSLGPAVEGRPTIQIHLGEITQLRRDQPFQVRLRYNLPSPGKLQGTNVLTFETLRFPLREGGVPVARVTRRLWLPQDLAYLDFDTDATKHFDETSLWEGLKEALGLRPGRERGLWSQGAASCQAAIARLQGLATATSAGLYPALDVRYLGEPRLFEKLDNPVALSVRTMSWPMFYVLDVLALVAIVALGVLLERRKLLGPAVIASAGTVLTLLGATFAGRALEPFFASGLIGAVGLGGYFLGRGVWRELTVLRHERRLAELAQEAQVARARAQAAEAEAKLRAMAPAVAAATATASPASPKATGPSAADVAAADSIKLDRGPGDAGGGAKA